MNYFPMILWHRPAYGAPKWCAQEGCDHIEEARELVRKRATYGPGGGAIAAAILTRKQYEGVVYGREPITR